MSRRSQFCYVAILSLACGLSACTKATQRQDTSAIQTPTPEPAQISQAKDALTFNQIEALITNEKLTSVEQLLQHLPKANLTDYAMIYDSRSLQFASLELPRIVLKSDHSQLLISFNAGHDSSGSVLEGGNKVEVIEYMKPERRFAFHEIEFSARGERVGTVSRNVPMCVVCHGGTDPRPNWGTYFHWKGVFGSVDDFYGDVGDKHIFIEKGYRHSDMDPDPLPADIEEIVETERQAIRDNIAKWRVHPRYGRLADMDAPDFTRAHFDKKRPNFFLQAQLYEPNMKRVARIVESSAHYESYRPLILGTLLCASDWPAKSSDYFPEGFRTKTTFQIEKENVGKRNSKTNVWDPFFWNFEARNISTRGWESVYRLDNPLTQDPFMEGAASPRDATYLNLGWLLIQSSPATKLALEQQLGLKEANSKYLYKGRIYEYLNDVQCQYLKEKSRAALTELWAQQPAQKELLSPSLVRTDDEIFMEIQPSVNPSEDIKSNRRIFGKFLVKNKCSICHNPGTLPAPKIPFSDEEELKTALHMLGSDLMQKIIDRMQTTPTTGDRMPLEKSPLNDEERASITEYLRSL